MKIFVTGYQRSGTTLLRQIFEMHPDVKKMFHERGLLRRSKQELFNAKKLPDCKFKIKQSKPRGSRLSGFQWDVDFNLKNETWGEKIPYFNLGIKKGGFRGTIIDYCNRWNDYFLPNARIIHIVRHPLAVGVSTKKRGFSKNIIMPIKKYEKSVPIVISSLNNFNNCMTIKYESLLLNPKKTIKKIFKFCKLNYSDKIINQILNNDDYWYFGGINKERALEYKKYKNKIEQLNLTKLYRILNEIEGFKYS